MLVSIDGVITPPDQATISIFDRGFLYGDGLFEVLRTWNARPVDLDAHLDRMADNAIGLAIDRAELEAHVRALIAAAGGGEWRIRIIRTRGQGGLTARFADVQNGHSIVILEPLGELATTSTAVFVEWDVPGRAIGYKSLAYLDSLIARELAAARGADQALRLGPDGSVVEGATANLFIVKHGDIATPPLHTGILPGITRQHVLTSCTAMGLTVRERRLTRDEVAAADEIFMTSAVRGVVAVTHLEGVAVGNGVRPITQKLASAYAERMSRATIPV